MRHPSRIAAVLLGALLLSSVQAAEPMFELEALPEFGFPMSRAHDVVANGHVHVAGDVSDGQVWRPALWSRNGNWQLVEMPIPGFTEGDGSAFGLVQGPTGELLVVGEVWVDISVPFPYLWTELGPGDFSMHMLPHNGEGGAHGIAVGPDVVLIAGWTAPGGGLARKGHDQGAMWIRRPGEDFVLELLPGFDVELNSFAHDASFFGKLPVAVGEAINGSGLGVPVLWTCDEGQWFLYELPLLPGGMRGQAHAVSRPNGQHKIVGWCDDVQGLRRPVRWVSDTGFDWEIQPLGPVASGEIHDVASTSGHDYQVGIASGRAGEVGTVWITNGAFQVFDLNTLIVGGPPSMTLLTAHGVTANGTVYIVGDGAVAGRGTATHAYLLEQQLTVGVPALATGASMPTLRANPNPATRGPALRFSLPHDERIVLTIHDSGGRLVARILETHLTAGDHVASWSGRDTSGREVAPGVYFARLQAGVDVVSSRVVILR